MFGLLGSSIAWWLAVSLGLGAGRALLIALQDDFAGRGLHELALWSFSRHLLSGLVWCSPAGLLLGWALRSARRSRRGRLTQGLLLLGTLLAFAFLTCRAPLLRPYVPELETPRGWLGNAVAGMLAIVALVALVRPPPLRRWPRLPQIVCAAVILGSLGAYSGARRVGASWPERPNVVLISLDTLRKDHLGCYGYGSPTSPELDRFAQRAVRFENAFSPYPWTLIAHVTLMTSLTPRVHGVNHERRLALGTPTLASRLRDEGYHTFAIVDISKYLSPSFGLGDGFDSYKRSLYPASQRVDRLRTTLDDLDRGPFFLFLHYFDAHSDVAFPYESDPEDRALLTPGFEGEFRGCREGLGCGTRMLQAMNEQGLQFAPDELEYVKGLYDSGIRTLDRALGEVLRELESRGLFENSVVVVTADHGESFGEHGLLLHRDLWEETVRIPLLVRTPAVDAARRVDACVALADIAPTLLDFCGLPAGRMQGRSFRPLVEGRGDWQGTGYVLLDDGWSQLGLRTPEWKLVRGPAKQWRLFDMLRDPGEQHDLYAAGASGDVVAGLQSVLERQLARIEDLRADFGPDGDSLTIDEAEAQQLRALGYADLLED